MPKKRIGYDVNFFGTKVFVAIQDTITVDEIISNRISGRLTYQILSLAPERRNAHLAYYKNSLPIIK